LSGEDCGALDEYLQQAEDDEKEVVVNDAEEKVDVVVSVFTLATETAAKDETREGVIEVEVDEEDDDEVEGNERVDDETPKRSHYILCCYAPVLMIIHMEIVSGGERSKHHHHHSNNQKKGSRNMTKKINKYGRIVRSDRNLTSSY